MDFRVKMFASRGEGTLWVKDAVGDKQVKEDGYHTVMLKLW